MKFKCIEFSWRAAFIGLYLTPERDRLWVTVSLSSRCILRKPEHNDELY